MMKKRLIFTLLLAAFIVACFAQKPYKVMFYNLENFFDTINDPEVLDDEFTPEGPKQWNSAKYTRKIGNLERVLFDIAAEDKDYPVVIGVSEIENRSVMEDVIAQLKALGRDNLIKRTETLDREALRREPAELLCKLGAYINQTDEFYYDVSEAEAKEL